MSWSSLPEEMVDLILAKLSVIELARIATTCHRFHAMYWEQMAAQQKSHRSLAVTSFGSGRLDCISHLIDGMLKSATWIPKFNQSCWHSFWVSANGEMHVARDPLQEYRPGTVFVSLFWGNFRSSFTGVLLVQSPSRSVVRFRFRPDRTLGSIEVMPTKDEDVEGVALVQTLLGQGLPQLIGKSGQPAYVSIMRHPNPGIFTRAGLKSQIGPLFPFASRYDPRLSVLGDSVDFIERILIWQGRLGAMKGPSHYLLAREAPGLFSTHVKEVWR
jgi:hypothetical protein